MSKTDDDPLKKATKEEETKRKKAQQEKQQNTIYTSLFIDEEQKLICEQIYDGTKNTYCCYNTEKQTIFYTNELQKDKKYYQPIQDEEVHKKAVLLPSKPETYENEDALDEEIKTFIHKWLDIKEDNIQFALWNIKRSWVYERFHTINYLRALGDTGQGKSRYLDTLGYLHYKSLFTSGATTPAPIFRMIEKWKGTLIIDEADFKQSDESQDIIKIINQGYEKGKHIMRCDQNDAKKVQFFDPFCPKIIATRKTFTDKATESRCITTVMTGTSREDIPYNLNEEFFAEAQSIRNKLLTWRFKNYYSIKSKYDENFDLGILEPRVKQITTSFISLFLHDEKQLSIFKKFIYKHQAELIEERKQSFDGQIIEAIWNLLERQNYLISSEDIIHEANLTDYRGNVLKPRGLNKYLKSLGFEKSELKRDGETVKRCIPLNQNHWNILCSRYGFPCNSVTKVTLVTVTSGFSKYEKNDNKKSAEKLTVTRVTNVTNVTEEDIEEEPIFNIINFPCSVCKSEPSHVFGVGGRPFCRDCFENFNGGMKE